MAHEDDVVLAFRQAVEEEMRKMQSGQARPPLDLDTLTSEQALTQLAARHEELEHEVALLRTIVLRLVSEPVDNDG